MMPEDILMSDGDNVLADTGNYETTETAAGKMYRIFKAKYGHWAVQSRNTALKFGRNYEDRQKWSERDKEKWIADTEECFLPLVANGEVSDVKVEEMPSTRGDSPRFRISWIDIRTASKMSVETDPSPWGT